MIKDVAILFGTCLIVNLLDKIGVPQWINVVIFMIVIFGVFIKIHKETTEHTNFKGNPYYNGRNKWTQEQWDNWDPCSKESIDELYKNEFKLDENGNWRYKGDHL